jgi:2-aminoadipate transaminase
MVAYEVSRGGFLDRHIHLIRKVYGERRDLMLAAMDRNFPPEVKWTHPQGGLFLWGTLPNYMDAADVLKKCIERNVAFVPGESFHPSGGGKNTMRINFSNATPENIEAGIQRMGQAIGEKAAKQVAM